ncbi:MAG: PilT/PilU family type 4a pilus ATPase [Planctomycetes bacterium]|nr:PilT/PilU family type 4a pilus ATPase [Planctomycetota bacterium]
MSRLLSFLSSINDNAIQDIFFFSGKSITIRKGIHITKIDDEIINQQEMQELIDEMLDETQKLHFERHGEIDAAFHTSSGHRFRANIFRRVNKLAAVLRYVKNRVPTFEDLNLPAEQLKDIAALKRGLVLVVGTAGSGKSTTVASILEYMNRNFERHIVTIEDPIEFLFHDNKCLITQRELGTDTANYETALKHVVRQSPDVIFIGELRDKSTMDAALHAAETGHLVITTLHTKNSVQTIDRISNFFMEQERRFLNSQLASILQSIVAQRLIPTKANSDIKVPACEVMFNTPTIKDLMEQGNFIQISQMIKESKVQKCTTFNHSLLDLINRDLIDHKTALEYSDAPEELSIELKGFTHHTKFE